MTHSIELLLDPASDGAVRGMWQMLDDAGLPSQGRVVSDTNRPHVTLLAAPRISADVDKVLRPLAARFPLGLAVGAPVVFGGPRLTLARLVVPSADLLALHAEVYRRTLPYVSGDLFGHCRPGHWTAHVTLGRRFDAQGIGAAMGVLTAAAADLAAEAIGLRRWDGDRRVDHLLV